MSQSTDSDSQSESADESAPNASRTTGPGTIAITDKTTPTEQKPVDHYSCPFCDFDDRSERVVRAHITREDDAAHKNRNAFLDQIKIQAVDADGEIIKDIDAPGTTRFEGDETTELLPEGVADGTKKAAILREAVKNPEKQPADIAETIYDDRDRSSYPYSLIGDHLSTVRDEDPVTTPDDVDLDELPDDVRERLEARTDNQKATILTEVYNPDLPTKELAKRLDVHPTTPGKTLQRYGDLIDELRVHLTTHDSPAGEHPADGEGDEDSPESPETEPKTEPEPETETGTETGSGALEDDVDMLRVPRGDLQRFESRLAGIKETAEFNDDDSMLFVLSQVEGFLATAVEDPAE